MGNYGSAPSKAELDLEAKRELDFRRTKDEVFHVDKAPKPLIEKAEKIEYSSPFHSDKFRLGGLRGPSQQANPMPRQRLGLAGLYAPPQSAPYGMPSYGPPPQPSYGPPSYGPPSYGPPSYGPSYGPPSYGGMPRLNPLGPSSLMMPPEPPSFF